LPESLLNRRLTLGTYLGIELFVHWSFGLLVLFVALNSLSEGMGGVLFAIAQLFGVFFCVTLHEYGHAMAARRYGIGTADITLLPIGGVARLRRMPKVPWQELVIAVAGPAVNVVIAACLLGGFFLLSDRGIFEALISYFRYLASGETLNEEMVMTINDIFVSSSLIGFGLLMLLVNIMLVVFNMIPAFPMDGGRVFRALLAMLMNYRDATMIASRVGLVCAAAMAIYSLNTNPSNPIPVLIAVFIGYAGIAEARQVDVMESVQGLTVSQVMIQTGDGLPMDLPLSELAKHWESRPMPSLPVVTASGIVVGMLRLRDVVQAFGNGTNPATTAGQLVNHEVSPSAILQSEKLEVALMSAGKQSRQVPVVNEAGQLVGIVDIDSMRVRGELAKLNRGEAITHDEDSTPASFDQTS
jgi:Zn-dependent protease